LRVWITPSDPQDLSAIPLAFENTVDFCRRGIAKHAVPGSQTARREEARDFSLRRA